MLEALHTEYKRYSFGALLTLQKFVIQWNQKIQTRRVLLEMDDWQLNDIGIDRKAANSEEFRKFWQ